MSGGAWQEFDRACRDRAPVLALELLGKPDLRTAEEWRWGRKGSLALVVSGERRGLWFDHESGEGGGLPELVALHLRTNRQDAIEWIASRIGVAPPAGKTAWRKEAPRIALQPVPVPPASVDEPRQETPGSDAADRASRIWIAGTLAPADHPYLVTKQVTPLSLRVDRQNRLIVPLQDVDGEIHSVEYISADGAKRYLAGGAKRGHFSVVGGEPGALAAPIGPLLLCEGWATGASLHIATGHPVVAAMDAGNLLPVAEALRGRFPDADLVIVADNDIKDGRTSNPGVEAARKVAGAIDARLAIPAAPGDANDLYCAHGSEAVTALVSGAARLPQPGPTHPAPTLSPDEARAALAEDISRFMQGVTDYWQQVDDPPVPPVVTLTDGEQALPWLDFNDVMPENRPPLLGLAVDVGLGKTSATRQAIADLLRSGALGNRKVVFAVPRHDLGAEQVAAFRQLGISAMLWKGRTAEDPIPENPQRLMCLDPDATFDALFVEHPVEQSCCSVRRDGVDYLCPHYPSCGYQRQKPEAEAASVVVCAHDSLFYIKPEVIGTVGLLVIDEGFWQAGLRGLDGKATITLDGLEPVRSSPVCYKKNKLYLTGTADLVASRMKLWKALQASDVGPLRHGLLEAAGLTPEECQKAAALEHRRLRDAGLIPGMPAGERYARIRKILPPEGIPWAPPGRCATLWLVLAEALKGAHEVASVEVFHDITEGGSVKSLRLRWRSRLRGGWAAGVPILHLDATLRQELVEPYLPWMEIGPLVAAQQPHVRVLQVTSTPTSAKALTPLPDAPQRDHRAAETHLREIRAWISLRARQFRSAAFSPAVLVIGQKAAIAALRAKGLPGNVDAIHFNGLSGLDRWGVVRCLIVLGRTLPAPVTVERSAMALTGRMPLQNREDAGWWYPLTERYLRMANGRAIPLLSEYHTDPVAEAIRWCICEGELIQAIGRGRGVNRTAETPLAIDIFSDAVLPFTINEVAAWPDLRPQRRDLMALEGVILENAADMAACFPSLWPSADAARQDRQRSVTNCYYRDLYNSRMSHSSAEVTYQPEGPGQRSRTAQFDLGIIRAPHDWLVERLGPLSKCHIVMRDSDVDTGVEEFGEEASGFSVDSAASQSAQVNDV